MNWLQRHDNGSNSVSCDHILSHKLRYLSILSLALISALAFVTSTHAKPALVPQRNQLLTPVEGKVIYGNDDRKEIFEEMDHRYVSAARATAALIDRADLSKQPTGEFLVKGANYGTSNRLCPEERFYEQTSVAYCSGFLISPDLMITAGHCIASARDCSNTYFAFGFGFEHRDQSLTHLPAQDIYTCKEVIHSVAEGSGADFAIVRLDRPVVQRQPLRIRKSGVVANGDALVVIGHPAGIPTKIASGAKVRSTNQKAYFEANLDTYGGNSGSGVLNATTMEVEGILVRGEIDFARSPKGCLVSHICKDDGCRGEDVTRISEILPFLPSDF